MSLTVPRCLHWDLWCHVVDNYGDAGVCWRLARRLVQQHGQRVRLWIDAPAVLARLWPAIDATADGQTVAGVELRHWRAGLMEAECVDCAEVVIEAFGCELPAAALATLRTRRPLWLNLEYLSAEAWVEGCHGLGSRQTGGLTRYFFFPGFTPATGGLLGADADAALRDERAARDWLAAHGVQAPAAQRLSLFGYGNAALPGWLEVLAGGDEPWLVLVPQGRMLRAVGDWLGAPLAVGQACGRGALTVQALPFLAQDDYDRLLSACTLNTVRGEDSFVRAQWARRPLLWQPYRQADDAHLDKLDAWLTRALAGLAPEPAAVARAAQAAWDREADFAACWPAYRAALPVLTRHASTWAERLAAGPELAAALVAFAQSKIE